MQPAIQTTQDPIFSPRRPSFNPADYRIRRYPKLVEAMTATEPNVLFCGPWGSGKTRLLAEKAYFLCGKYPGIHCCLVRREQKHLRRTTWKFLVDLAIPRNILDSSHYNKSEMEIKFPNGSEIIGAGLDDPQKMASTEFGFIGLEEAIEITEEEKFTWVEGRARQPGMPFHQVMYACNAGPPAHYLYQRFYMKKFGASNGDDRLIAGETLWDILPSSYQARMGMLKGRYRDRFILNKWVGYEGLVYDLFDPSKVIVPRFPISDSWDYEGSIDFGFHNPFVFQLWALDPDGNSYLDAEIYTTGKTINSLAPEMIKLMVERNIMEESAIKYLVEAGKIKKGDSVCAARNKIGKDGKVRIRNFSLFSDHDAEDRATLDEYGISTVAANKDVGPGIQSTYNSLSEGKIKFFEDALVEKDPVLEMKGEPVCTTDEIQGYVWADKAKEEPKKVRDHGLDALRYRVHSHENAAAPGFIFVRGS
jgi:PBSX family phage terminase large subunit